jgi:hypothetical protein
MKAQPKRRLSSKIAAQNALRIQTVQSDVHSFGKLTEYIWNETSETKAFLFGIVEKDPADRFSFHDIKQKIIHFKECLLFQSLKNLNFNNFLCLNN